MATYSKLTTQQVVTVGRFMWNNREEFSQMNKHHAFLKTVEGTGFSISRTTWEKLLKEMGIECDQYKSTVKSAISILKKELPIAEVVTQ